MVTGSAATQGLPMIKADEVAALARGEGCLGRSQDDEPVFILCAAALRETTMRHLVIDALEAYLEKNRSGARLN